MSTDKRNMEGMEDMEQETNTPRAYHQLVWDIEAGLQALQFFGDPVISDIMRNVKKPMYTGRSADWHHFTIDWDFHWKKVSSGRKLSDDIKLQAFESTLDEGSRAELQLYRRKGKRVTFAEFFARMEERHGSAKKLGLRKVWQETNLPTGKKIGKEEWQDFQIRFETARHDVEDATPDEAYRLLIEKLPPFISNWVVEQEDKMTRQKPTLEVVGVPGMSILSMTDSVIELTGQRPLDVIPRGGRSFWVKMEGEAQARKMLGLHGRRMEDSAEPLLVRKVDMHMEVDDIFELVTRKFELRDRQDLVQSLRENNRNTRSQRQTSTSEATSKAENTPPPRLRKKTPGRRNKPKVEVTIRNYPLRPRVVRAAQARSQPGTLPKCNSKVQRAGEVGVAVQKHGKLISPPMRIMARAISGSPRAKVSRGANPRIMPPTNNEANPRITGIIPPPSSKVGVGAHKATPASGRTPSPWVVCNKL